MLRKHVHEEEGEDMHNNIWKDGLSQPCGDQQPPSATKKFPLNHVFWTHTRLLIQMACSEDYICLLLQQQTRVWSGTHTTSPHGCRVLTEYIHIHQLAVSKMLLWIILQESYKKFCSLTSLSQAGCIIMQGHKTFWLIDSELAQVKKSFQNNTKKCVTPDMWRDL